MDESRSKSRHADKSFGQIGILTSYQCHHPKQTFFQCPGLKKKRPCASKPTKKKNIATHLTKNITNVDSPTPLGQLPSFNWFNSHCKAFFSQFLSVSCELSRVTKPNHSHPCSEKPQAWVNTPSRVGPSSQRPTVGPVLGAAFDVPSSTCRCSRRGLHLSTSHSPGWEDFFL